MSKFHNASKLAALGVSSALVLGGMTAAPASVPGAQQAPRVAERDLGKKGHHTLFGSTAQRRNGITYRRALRRTNIKFQGVDVVRVFHRGLPRSWRKLRRGFGKNPLIVSFKASPRKVIAGTYDRRLTRWFRNAPKNRRTFWSYYHEPEDNIESGEFTARQYRRAWQHLNRLAARAHNGKLRSTLVLMAWSLDPRSNRRWRRYYVPKAVEVLGWDAYNHKVGDGRYVAPRTMFRRVIRVSRRNNRPYGIAELGSLVAEGDNGKRRARWLRRTGRYLARHNASFVSYFDSNVVEGDFRLKDRRSWRAWRHVVNKIS